jgi:hypothetical protein
VTGRSTRDADVGDLVVPVSNSRYGLVGEDETSYDASITSAGIGIVVDKVPGYGPEFDCDVLHVLWSDGATRSRWAYQVLPLKE